MASSDSRCSAWTYVTDSSLADHNAGRGLRRERKQTMTGNAPLLRATAVVVLALATTTCRESLPPGHPLPSNAIVDGANGGNAHFFFLPPLRPQPVPNGAFDGSLPAVVEVCAVSQCGISAIARFGTTTGTGSEQLRVSVADELYIVNWHTDEFVLDPAVTYRIRVLVGGTVLGYADVDVVRTGSELKRVDNGQFIPLLNGRTLPIKFRIEQGAVGVVNHEPVVDAGAEQTVNLPATATLNGSVDDDGLPPGSALAIMWSKVSGPGTVTFSPPDAEATTASFSEAGTYVLRLAASDGEFTVSDETTITVIPQNQAPVVDAGPDLPVTLPNTATLNGTVTDDGLPAGSTLTITWSKVSGPGTVTFGSADAVVSTASFSEAGAYVLRLTASDGDLTSTDEVAVTVGLQNQAPMVNAGPDQAVTNLVELPGTVTDDGLPTGSTLTIGWSKVSGPGAVTFSNPTGAATTASFSEPGSYLLRLSASEGDLTGSDEATVTVTIDHQGPVVTIVAPHEGQVVGAIHTLRFEVDDPGATVVCAVDGLTIQCVPGEDIVMGPLFDGPHSFTVTAIDLGNSSTSSVAYLVDATGPVFDPSGTFVPPLPAAPSSTPATAIRFVAVDQSPPVRYQCILDGAAAGVCDPTAGAGVFEWASLPDGNHLLTVTPFDAFGNVGAALDIAFSTLQPNQPPVVNAGPDLAATLPNSATLTGSVEDDGLPAGSTLAISWSKVSGPGTVTFANPDIATTTAAFSEAGTYVVRLTASDGEFTISDEAAVTVSAQNQPPVVSAGSDLTTSLPNAATLNGSVTDDGLPAGSTLTISWSQLSGPGTATFTNPNAASTAAGFSAPGTYVVRLTASDGDLTATDEATITVIPQNQAPVVNGGPDLTVTLPNAATLTGSVTDDGLPSGSTLTINWTTVSGPGMATFANPNAAGTTAAFAEAGSYTLRLTASDGEFTVSDEATVTVNPINNPPAANAGADQTVVRGTLVTLDGTGSIDLDGNPLTYAWSVKTRPAGSVALLVDPTSVHPTFTPDVAGTYEMQLIVHDGEAFSLPDVSLLIATVPGPPITIPAGGVVGKDLQTNRTVQLGAAAPAGGVLVTLTSESPDLLVAPNATTPGGSTATIAVPAGSSSGTFFVQALAASGTPGITASAPGYTSGAGTVTLRPSGFIIEAPISITTTTLSANSNVQVASYQLNPTTLAVASQQPIRAGLGPVQVEVTSSNTSVGTVTVSPVAFNSNVSSVSTAFDPAGAGTTTISVVPPAGFSTPSNLRTIAANVTAPGLTIPSFAVGKDLQTSRSVSLGAPAPAGGLSVTIVSNNSDVLLAPNGTTAGSTTLTVTVAASNSAATFFVQALAGSGSAGLTATAPAYATGNGTVTMTPAGFIVESPILITTTTLSGNANVQVASYQLNPATLAIASQQQIRAGLAPVLVEVTSSNTTVGSITVSPVTFNPNVSSVSTAFNPAAAGTTTIAVVPPAGFSTPSNFRTITANVTAPSLTIANFTVGNDLQTSRSVSLGAPAPAGGLSVTIVSNNPNLLLAPNSTTPGSTTLTLTVPASNTSASFFAQALAGSGTAGLTATAAAYAVGNATATMVPSGFIIESPISITTTTLSGNSTVQVTLHQLNPTTLAVVGQQQVRAGHPPVLVDLSSSNTTVGVITVSPVTFNPGISGVNTAFNPGAAGTSTVSVVQPAGFSTPSNFQSITATVSAPNLTVADVTVGKDLQTNRSVSLGAPAPAGGLPITIVSNNPAVLVAPNATTVGTTSLVLTVPAGNSTASFFVQSLAAGGTGQLTLTAPAFNPDNATITLSPSGFTIDSPGNFTTTAAAGNTNVQVVAHQLNSGTLTPGTTQGLRAGLNGVMVDVLSSNPAVGAITVSPVVFNQSNSVGNTAFNPAAAGSAVISIGTPAGFSRPFNGQQITATVN